MAAIKLIKGTKRPIAAWARDTPKWQVVLYLEAHKHYAMNFDALHEAMTFASLEKANPNWSSIVVHKIWFY